MLSVQAQAVRRKGLLPRAKLANSQAAEGAGLPGGLLPTRREGSAAEAHRRCR
jgi:hypothetical protein